MKARDGDRGQFFWLADEDVSAARRILSILSFSAGPADRSDAPAPSTGLRSIDHQQALERAQVALALRKRRIEVLAGAIRPTRRSRCCSRSMSPKREIRH